MTENERLELQELITTAFEEACSEYAPDNEAFAAMAAALLEHVGADRWSSQGDTCIGFLMGLCKGMAIMANQD